MIHSEKPRVARRGPVRPRPPASAASRRSVGYWRPGDHPGERRFAELGPVALERGGRLPAVCLAYETWGRLDPARDNAVLLLHGLFEDSHAAGEPGPGHPSPGWWSGLVGPGSGIDTDRWFVVCPNVLGGCQGSTGPSTPAPDGRAWGHRWPEITIRDQVTAEVALADTLGIDRWAAVCGGSLGGMRALEWAIGRPDRVDRAIVLAAGAEASADQVAGCSVQIGAIRSDPGWLGGDYYEHPPGPVTGMATARSVARLAHATAHELDARFGRAARHGRDPLDSGFAVAAWLDRSAIDLARRFDAGTYVTLSGALISHDVGRGRGGTRPALRRMRATPTIVGVNTDRLSPLREQSTLAAMLDTDLHVIGSPHGHHGYLAETEQLIAILTAALH